MPVPGFQNFMLPILEFLSDGIEHSSTETYGYLASRFGLTSEQLGEMLPSGTQTVFYNRVSWARGYLKMAGLIENTRRGHFQISQEGIKLLDERPAELTLKSLKKYPAFLEKYEKPKEQARRQSLYETQALETPEELLAVKFSEIQEQLVADLLAKIKSASPGFFERLVVQLLVKMGYGGSFQEAGQTTRLSKDGGIDGIIKEDKLGLDQIFLQAKRWDKTTVGSAEVQAFVGVLDGQRANKGVFITTSKFSSEARQYVRSISKKVVLIDGDQLARYMIEHDLGVGVANTYVIKRIDNDYFDEE